MSILTLSAVYAGSLLLTWLAIGLAQATITGHRFFDDDVGAAMATVLIPVTTGVATLGFAIMAAWILPRTDPAMGMRTALITAAAGAIAPLLQWLFSAAMLGLGLSYAPASRLQGQRLPLV